MKPGQVIVVLRGFDNRIREKGLTSLIKGTIVNIFGDQLEVLLENNDIWIGSAKDVTDVDSQTEV